MSKFTIRGAYNAGYFGDLNWSFQFKLNSKHEPTIEVSAFDVGRRVFHEGIGLWCCKRDEDGILKVGGLYDANRKEIKHSGIIEKIETSLFFSDTWKLAVVYNRAVLSKGVKKDDMFLGLLVKKA